MQILKLIEVHLWDGGDRHNYGHTFDAATTSEKELKEKFKHCMLLKKSIVLFEGVTDYDTNKDEERKQKILEKLTEDERKILGF
jgi:hypothetical protein